MDIKLVCIDIDGTATDGPGKPLMNQDKLSCAITHMQEKGFVVYFVTGRDVNYVDDYLKQTGINANAICEMGAIHYHNGFVEYLGDSVNSFVNIRGELEELIESDLTRNYPGWNKEPKHVILTYNPPKGITTKALYESLVPIFKKYNTIDVTYSSSAVDISPKGVDKASAIITIMKQDNITGDIAAIGDSKGDLPMLKIARYIGAPENATEEIKSFVREKKGFITRQKTTLGTCSFLTYIINLEKKLLFLEDLKNTLPSYCFIIENKLELARI